MSDDPIVLAAAPTSATFGLLARSWLREVDQQWYEALNRSPLRDEYVAAGGTLPGDDLEELAADYCQLFLGPSQHLPPMQSVWQSGQLQGDAATSMQTIVDVIGYDTAQVPEGVMLDHLGVQMDVMRHLLHQVADWPGDETDRSEIVELSRFFFSRHLTWPRPLLAQAADRAQSDFYRGLVSLTTRFLDAQAELLLRS